jgi:hypothetical protein
MRPKHARMTDDYWNLIVKCWADPPEARPAMDKVHETVRQFYEAHSPDSVPGPNGEQIQEEHSVSAPLFTFFLISPPCISSSMASTRCGIEFLTNLVIYKCRPPTCPPRQELPDHTLNASVRLDDPSDVKTPGGNPNRAQDALTRESQNEDRVAECVSEEGFNSLLDLTGQITRENVYPSAFGGFSDVWVGTWHKKSGSCKVYHFQFVLTAFRTSP